MNIFSKLFKKLSKKPKKDKETVKDECWYNNAAEQAEGFNPEVEGQALTSPNAFDCAVTKSTTMK